MEALPIAAHIARRKPALNAPQKDDIWGTTKTPLDPETRGVIMARTTQIVSTFHSFYLGRRRQSHTYASAPAIFGAEMLFGLLI
jgi:hypothetical protein